MHPIKSGPGLHTCQPWGPLVYTPESLRHLSQYSDWQNWHLYKRKVLAAFSKAIIYTTTKECLKVVYPTTWQIGDLKKGLSLESYLAQ